MRTQRTVTCWDYHHGQSTRILVSGHPHVTGQTMRDVQEAFRAAADDVRAALCQEPRGHRNMLGAVIVPPLRETSVTGVLFTSPDGYFDMCGDSSFSLGGYLADSGLVAPPGAGSGDVEVNVDTVAGEVGLRLRFADGELVSTTIGNVASSFVGRSTVELEGHGTIGVEVAYGGLTYAFVDARDVGLSTLLLSNLDESGQRELIATGSAVWRASRSVRHLERPIDLVTLWEPLEDTVGTRVANFYASGTMGRTPSGTGLSAHLANEYALGRLGLGEAYVHESALGLRFTGMCVEATAAPGNETEPSAAEVVPELAARSYLMGVNHVYFEHDDPFPAGFAISA